jgi:hypothetical protein
MARYIAWIGERGTIKATSLQPYLLAVNGFFKDHDAEPVAHSNLVVKSGGVSLRPKFPSSPAAHACTCQPGFLCHRYA